MTRYFGSSFPRHATAEDMMHHFEEMTQGLDRRSLFQVSMDGPNVNWKFFEMLQKKLEDDIQGQLLNIGSCGLHTVHNAFRRGLKILNGT